MFLKSSKTKPTGGLLRFQHLVEDEEKKGTDRKAFGQGRVNYSTKGRVPAGFCSNQATAHETPLIQSAGLSLQTS